MPIFEGPINQDDFKRQQADLNDKVMRRQWAELLEEARQSGCPGNVLREHEEPSDEECL